MNTEEIQNFIKTNKISENNRVKITFKKRSPINGIIVQSMDSAYLEAKNFWRIITSTYLNEWQSTKDISLSRLFNGSEFKKIVVE